MTDYRAALLALTDTWITRSYQANRDGNPGVEVVWEQAADELLTLLEETA